MIPALRRFRLPLLLLVAALTAACAAQNDLDKPPPPLGQFVLGLNVVVTDNMQKVPISRDATAEEWKAALEKAIADRFGRYEGDRIYNFGVSIDAYALAPPGIPIVASPKSALAITANVWDDATATKLNFKGKQITVMEGVNGETLVGSGLTRTKEQQMAALSYNAAKAIETWLLEHPEWFTDHPTPEPPPPPPGAAAAAPAPAN